MEDIQYKCGYCCEWRLKYEQLEQHSFFANTDVQSLVMNNVGTVFMTETEAENAIDKDRLDEDLITAVRNRPALYDFRLPLKARGRKQKDALWNEVSVYLKGLYTPNEAEKRWNYLKDSYRKARNVYKKRVATEQRSGSASTSQAIVLSFRHYDVMTFLNDTLEYRQTITSLKSSKNQASTSSVDTDPLEDVQFNVNNDTLECGSFSSSSDITSVSSKKRKNSLLNKNEDDFLDMLKENKEPNPIDGFVLRLAEGLKRLPYKQRAKLEIYILTKLYEIENTEKI